MKSGKNQYICSAGRNKLLPCPGFVLSGEKTLQWRASEFSHLQHPIQRNMEFWLLLSSAHDYWISDDRLFAPKLFFSICLTSTYCMIIRVFQCEWFRQLVPSKWRKDETMEVKVALRRYQTLSSISWVMTSLLLNSMFIYSAYYDLWWYWIFTYWFDKWDLQEKNTTTYNFSYFFTKNNLSTWCIG